MTYEQKLLVALAKLEENNTEEEASNVLASLLHDSTMSLPQRGWYKDEYVKECRERKNTAKIELRKLPYGEDILKQEEKFARS